MWALAADHAPDHAATADGPLIVDVDATLVTAFSEKQDVALAFKRGFGFPAFVRVRLPRRRRHRGTVGGAAAAGECRIEHGRRTTSAWSGKC